MGIEEIKSGYKKLVSNLRTNKEWDKRAKDNGANEAK